MQMLYVTMIPLRFTERSRNMGTALTLERTIYRLLKAGRPVDVTMALEEGTTEWDSLTVDELQFIFQQTVDADENHIYFRQFCDNWRNWNLAIRQHQSVR
jgi:hypothetical protein